VPLLTLVCSRSGGYAAHCKGFCVSSKLANWTKIASCFSLREKVRVHITMHEARHHNPWFNVSGLAFVSLISIHPCHLTGYDFSCIASASYTFGCLLSAFHNRPVDVHACRVLGRGRCDFVFEFPLVSERGQSQNVSLQHLPHRSCLLGRRWLNHRSMHKHIMTIGGLCSQTIPTRRLYSVPLRSCAHFSVIADF